LRGEVCPLAGEQETMRTLKSSLLAFLLTFLMPFVASSQQATEAPTGFDGLTNGFVSQAEFDEAKEIFDEVEEEDEGLGPVFNARGCGECHQNPVVGGISQITEMRAGRFDGRTFVEHPGGSLINDRAIHADAQERVLPGYNVLAFRSSLNTLGDGFVECIDDATLAQIAGNQPPTVRGEIVEVAVREAGGQLRAGRFGWKNQHASLVSFSADAYKNEMGITSPLDPDENSSMGNPVTAYDHVADPEDEGEDVELFAKFMRATKAPPRDAALAATPEAQAGDRLFTRAGCDVCHTRAITTAPAGTAINGGQFSVPPALGDKVIRPFSDFLLHDVGTGDGIVQNGGPSTRNKLRTPPLWGVRTRSRLMHDGGSLTFNDAILRHRGQAAFSMLRYRFFTPAQKRQLEAFLRSL
jgi:CxxC motif-containing protein (DUF1111 family)